MTDIDAAYNRGRYDGMREAATTVATRAEASPTYAPIIEALADALRIKAQLLKRRPYPQ